MADAAIDMPISPGWRIPILLMKSPFLGSIACTAVYNIAMKITILAYGSRGDVQPFIPLSLGLMTKGHIVKLAAPYRFQNLVEDYGIKFVPLAGDPGNLSRRFNDAGNNLVRIVSGMIDYVTEVALDVLHQTEEASEDADLIIHTFLHAVGAHTIAREKRIPDIHIQTFPMFSPTGDYPNVTLPDLKFSPLNRLTHILATKMSWWGARLGFHQICRRAGLPKRRLYWPFDKDSARPQTPILCAWSPSVIPPSRDWPPNVIVTGWYFLESTMGYSPSSELRLFLESGEPPVCVSFGSMVNRDAEKIDRIIREALVKTGNRGIILSGWSQMRGSSSNNILYTDAVPHHWLLPQCKMIIHHGGAGTTSAGLQAGIPNIVVPFTVDQPFWGRRVHTIGAGPMPIPVKKLSTEWLTQAILDAETHSYRERAAALGRKIRSESGTDHAIHFIENYAKEFYRQQL
jgi:sterol 3beta-glucosyltransferase